MKIKRLHAIPVLVALAFTLCAAAQSSSQSKEAYLHPWWKNAVIYEIYPRSFQDSNGDGIGDLNGITSRLGYLQALGIDAVWLTPIYPSPQVDFGYDISDYTAIDPQYGTLSDYDQLVAQGKDHNIGVIMDLVLNHTSDKHPWFIESASSRNNPKADWYMWRDPKMVHGKPQPPNNWISVFGGSAWQWDPARSQYYYHRFYIQQPDLNWTNPEVRKAMYDVERFWINRGTAGFRLDAITSLFEDPTFSDEDYVRDASGNIEINAYGDKEVDTSKTDNLPKVNEVLKELRHVADTTSSPKWPHKVVLIGETYVNSIDDLRRLYGPHDDELNLPMDMQIGFINKLDVPTFRKNISDAESLPEGDQPLFVFDNHDNQRFDRYSDGHHTMEIGKMLAAILFMSRNTAMMYYGDEIGMKTTQPTRKADVRDPIGVTGWPKEKGRDGERTPMQWDSGPNAGFSKPGVKTWLPIPDTFITVNVKSELAEPTSMINWYKKLIELRHTLPAFQQGRQIMLDTDNNQVLSWLRYAPGHPAVVVACNFTAMPQSLKFDLSAQGIHSNKALTIAKTPGLNDPSSLDNVTLPPFGVYVGEVQ